MPLDDAYEFFNEAIKDALAWLTKEISTLRTGRVKPDLVASLPVEHYGTRTPLQGLATLTSTDARTLTINPWDPGVLAAIEKAITHAELGVQPIVDGKIVRLSFPSLTEEIRGQTIKILNKKTEEARVRLRQARDGALEILKDNRKGGAITEDDFYDGRSHLDAMIEHANEEIGKLVMKKEEEIRTI